MRKTPLEKLLNVFWLRPETALWRALDIKAMKTFEFRSPSLDLGCGDGIFSFSRANGEFSSDFDAFRSLSKLDQFFENADIFNHCDDSFSPTVSKPPDYKIDYAFDHKESLLRKAGAIGLYSKTIQGDANHSLPFENDFLGSIFSNILYWLDDPGLVFKEIYRVLKQGGQGCFFLPNTTFTEFSFFNALYKKSGLEKFSFLEKLDRGRMHEIKQARSHAQWEKIIQDSGLHIVHHGMHLSKTVIQIWDIGMRPLFPVLLKMANEMNEQKLLEIKAEWIEICNMFLAPIVALDADITQGEEPAFHCYIVEKP